MPCRIPWSFDSPDPTGVIVYRDLEWARESLESRDVVGGGGKPGCTATGQIVDIEPSAHLFATIEVAEDMHLERPQARLRQR